MIVLGPLVLILSFFGMEFMAWFTHKFVMHGFMWKFHRDHHQVEEGFFERNDVFFMIYAIPSWLLIMLGSMNGYWIPVWIGFTPLPYKAFTIASGVVGFSLPVFIVVSLISRSLRFFIVAYLSYKFGDLFTEFMEKHGSKWFTIIGILIVIVLGIIFLIFKFNA